MQEIFDRKLLKNNFEKNYQSIKVTNFLADYAADLLIDKLLGTKLSFSKVLNLGSRSDRFYTLLRERNSKVEIVETCLSHKLFDQKKGVTQIECDEESLPFKQGEFDLVVAIFNFHQINDLVGCLVQIHNILRDKGLLLASFPGGETLTELRKSCLVADSKFNATAPKISPFIDVKTMGALLQRSGYHMPITDIDNLTVEYKDPQQLFLDLKNMGEANILKARSKNLLSPGHLNEIKKNYIKNYKIADIVPATFEFINLTAFKN